MKRTNFRNCWFWVHGNMVKSKFGPFSRVGGDDRLIDNINLC